MKGFAEVVEIPETKKDEKYIFGTIKNNGDSSYVTFDGSDFLTPITSAMGYEDGDRVMVMVKSHRAIVVNNMTSPAVTGKYVKENYASFDNLSATNAQIGYLRANMITTDVLEAKIGEFGYLKADVAELKFASIESLNATNAEITNLKASTITADNLSAEVAKLGYASVKDLEATTAKIDDLTSKAITTDNLTAETAKLGYLTANQADIRYLTVSTADTKFLHADMSDMDIAKIQTLFATAGIVSDMTIKDGHITGELSGIKVSANDISAGRLDAATIEVVNLNAANITVGTINGTQIATGAIDLSKLGSDVTNKLADTEEDVAKAVADAKKAITDSATAQSTANSATSTANSAKNTANSATSTANSALSTANSATATANSANSLASTAKSTADSANTTASNAVSIANNISVGGRNLLRNSALFSIGASNYESGTWRTAGNTSMSRSTVDITDPPTGCSGVKKAYQAVGKHPLSTLDAECIGIDNFPYFGNEECDVVFSGWARVVGGDDDCYFGFSAYNCTFPNETILHNYAVTKLDSGGKWTRVIARGKYDGKSNNIYCGFLTGDTNVTVQACAIKFEKGNRATDWTPAPEDVDSSINTASIKNWCYNGNLAWMNGAKIYANTIVSDAIATDAITAVKIKAGAITADKLAANSITAGKIAANAVTAGTIAAGSITTDKLSAKAITSEKIATDAVTADKILAKSITAVKIKAGAITADKLAANSVTAGKIKVDSLSAISANIGTVTAGTIQSNNYVKDVSGMKLSLTDGSWDSKYTKINGEGKIECSNLNITGGSINIQSADKDFSFIRMTASGGQSLSISPATLSYNRNDRSAHTVISSGGMYIYSNSSGIECYCDIMDNQLTIGRTQNSTTSSTIITSTQVKSYDVIATGTGTPISLISLASSLAGLADDNVLKSNRGWYPNGKSLYSVSPGVYSTNPRAMPGNLAGLNSYGTLLILRENNYQTAIYMSVVGQLAIWASNSNAWSIIKS